MAGGQGTRFWPLSVQKRPKQFLNILGERSMLQETVARLHPVLSTEDIFVVSSQPYLKEIKAQLPELGDSQLIVEPAARNTAACIGLSAGYLQQSFPEEVMVVLPSDHMIREVGEFHEVLRAAAELAQEDWLVTFGIEPAFPSTGYGYLKCGEEISRVRGREAFRVESFMEKPDREAAEKFLQGGGHYWNSGMFVWKVESILNEIERSMPRLHEGLLKIRNAAGDAEKVAEIFGHFENISIDYGVMERSERVATLPCNLGWSDVGSWVALEEFLPTDRSGIAANCTVENVDSRNSLVFAEKSRLVALIGVRDLVLVETPNALLVCSKDRTEEVKKVVQRLREDHLEEYL